MSTSTDSRPALAFSVEILEDEGMQGVGVFNAAVGGNWPLVDKEPLVHERAHRFVARVEDELARLGFPESVKEFLLVLGNDLKQLFELALSGYVTRELDRLALQIRQQAAKADAKAHHKQPEGYVCVLFCPLGSSDWYNAYMWQSEEKPAYAGEYIIPAFDKARFDDLKQWVANHAGKPSTETAGNQT